VSASGPDTTPPSIASLSPADDATGVSTDADLVITFDEDVAKGNGSIVIKRSDDDSAVEAIDVTNAVVTVSGATVTIDPPAGFETNTGYYVQIDPAAFDDSSTNSFPGITNATTWNFMTIDAFQQARDSSVISVR